MLLVALVAGALVFAACGGSAAPTPDPTAAPAMMSLSDIDETTTGAELIASLSEGEADCLRAAIGDASYEAMQDLTLSESAMGFDTFPLGPSTCLAVSALGASLIVVMLCGKESPWRRQSRLSLEGMHLGHNGNRQDSGKAGFRPQSTHLPTRKRA